MTIGAIIPGVALALMPALASAHVDAANPDFVAGWIHVFTGPDHLAVASAIGLAVVLTHARLRSVALAAGLFVAGAGVVLEPGAASYCAGLALATVVASCTVATGVTALWRRRPSRGQVTRAGLVG